MAHTPDEHVEVAELRAAVDAYERLVRALLTEGAAPRSVGELVDVVGLPVPLVARRVERVEQAAPSRVGQPVEVRHLVGHGIAGPVRLTKHPEVWVHRAKHVVEGRGIELLLEPGFEPGHKVALQPQPNVGDAGHCLPGTVYEPEVVVELCDLHPSAGLQAPRQRVVTGDDDAFEALANGLGSVLLRLADGVVAQRRVHVRLVVERTGFDSGAGCRCSVAS